MNSSGPALTLRLAADAAVLEPTRLAVREVLGRQAPSARALYAVELVLEEVLTNLIKYAAAGRAAPLIELTLRVEPGEAVLHFEDDGPAFDPLQAPAPPVPASLDDAPIGGRGLLLLRHYAKSVTYERRDGRNGLTVGVALA